MHALSSRTQSQRRGRSVCRSSAVAPLTSQQQQLPQPFYQGSLLSSRDEEVGLSPYEREQPQRSTPPSIRDTGTLRPGPEWFPAWMKYRRRESNYVFWEDKFNRCSLEIPGVCMLCAWVRRLETQAIHPARSALNRIMLLSALDLHSARPFPRMLLHITPIIRAPYKYCSHLCK